MQINVRRIKLSPEFVRTVRKREAVRGNDLYVSSETKVYRHQSISFCPSIFPLNLIPRFLSSILWLADAVTSGEMPLFRSGGYARGVTPILFDASCICLPETENIASGVFPTLRLAVRFYFSSRILICCRIV